MLAIVQATLAKHVVVLKRSFRNMSKRIIISHIFEHLHPTTTCFDSHKSLSFKIFDKTNSKFGLKIKDALHVNWRKHNLNAQSFRSHTFTKACVTPLFLSIFSFFLFHVFFSLIFDYNYRHFLLS